jgi:creatinine amidohydrolase/Fe(II)-dependent formamide hydrolase-like protein
MHKYEELLPDEFQAELSRAPIVYCAFGPMEYHGPHGALGMDPVKGYDMCLRAAEISGGIVFPMVPFAPGTACGPDGYVFDKPANRDAIRHAAEMFCPSLSMFTSIDLCEALYYELLESFAEDIGFKVCVAMGAHGPATKLVQKIAGDSPFFKGMKIIAAGSLTHNQDLIQAEYDRLGIPRISHGGMWESSMFMACNPEFVHPEKALKGEPVSPRGKWVTEHYGAQAVPKYDEIRHVSVEFGERLNQVAAERIAAEAMMAIKEMKEPGKE